jgi:hypothetical protein
MDEKAGRAAPDVPGTPRESAPEGTWGAGDDVERMTTEGTPENERLENLPEHEDDRSREADGSLGGGVMAAGGTAVDTGTFERQDISATDADENEGTTEDRPVYPVPPNR